MGERTGSVCLLLHGPGDLGAVCGCLWVSMQAVPSLRQSRGFQIQWKGMTRCTEMYSLHSMVSDFTVKLQLL